ncbi:MAG: hypothetical protein QXS11_03825, partial [Zestosphaera sp.]
FFLGWFIGVSLSPLLTVCRESRKPRVTKNVHKLQRLRSPCPHPITLKALKNLKTADKKQLPNPKK